MIKRSPQIMFLLCLGLFCISGCERKMKNQKISKDMKALKVSELSPKQVEDWKNVFDPWLMNTFGDCLRAHDFKMDCIDCGNIIMDVVLEITPSGKLEQYTILKTDFDCAAKSEKQTEALKTCMMNYFIGLDFPKSLRNLKLETRIGRVTKC